MSAKWLWGSVNIYASEEESTRDIKRAEIFKLDNTDTTYHFFGAASRKEKIKGIIIGTADRNQLTSDAINDVARTLVTPYETIANCKISGTVKYTPLLYAWGTFDGVTYSGATTPIYTVELEIVL